MTTTAHRPATDRTAFAGIGPLFPVVFGGYLALGLPLPVLALQVHDRLGFDAVTVGWVVGIQALSTVLTRQMAGRLTDTRGPKRAVLFGLPLAALAGLLYLVSDGLADRPGLSLVALLAGRILLGPAESLFLTGTMAWGIARLGPARTGRVMAWQGIGIFGALAIGAPLGLAIMARFGFAGVAVVALAVPLLALAVAVAVPPEPGIPGARMPFSRVLALIWRQGCGLMLAGVPFAALAAFISLHYAARGWTGAGLALSGFGLGYIAVRVFFAHWPDRFGGARVAAGSLAVEAIGQLVLWAAPDAAVALAGATLTGIGFSLVFPALGVEATRRVPPQSRGLAVGGFVAFLDLALGLTGPLAGLLATGFGYRAVFLAGALCCGLATLTLVGAGGKRASA